MIYNFFDEGGGYMTEITHNNKDVLFKAFSQNYRDKSLAVYGLDVPNIKQLLPSTYPVVYTGDILKAPAIYGLYE